MTNKNQPTDQGRSGAGELADRLKSVWTVLNDDGDEHGVCETIEAAIAALSQPKGGYSQEQIDELLAQVEESAALAEEAVRQRDAAISLPRQSEAEPWAHIVMTEHGSIAFWSTHGKAGCDEFVETNRPYRKEKLTIVPVWTTPPATQGEAEPSIGVGVDVSGDGVAVTVVHRERSLDTVIYSEVHPLPTTPAAQGEALQVDDSIAKLWRALVEAGGAMNVARWGAGNNVDKFASAVTGGMVAIERQLHPERFDDFPTGTTLAAPVVGDGMVLVPQSALDWLNGENGEFVCPPEKYRRGMPPPYWWRSEFRKRIQVAAAAKGDSQ